MINETADDIQTDKKPYRPPRWVRWLKVKLGIFGIGWRKQLKALAHFLVIGLAFLALNWLFSPNDPGWLKLNPSPWVLVPLYLGFQFGFVWGIVAGLLQVGARIMIAEMTPVHEVLGGGEQFLLWSMVLTGALGGFVRGVLNRQAEQKRIALRDSIQSNELLKSQVAILKHNEHELSNAMVSQGIDQASLTLSLQDVFTQNEDSSERDEAFLNLICERCGVQAAAIYYSAYEKNAVRTASVGDSGEFPNSMRATPMIRHAEHTGEIVTQRWFWEPFEPNSSETVDDRYLAVIAHPKGRDFRVLIVSQMMFENIHWENLWKLEASFRWLENASQNGKLSVLPIEWQKSDLKIAEPEPAVEQEARQMPAAPSPLQSQIEPLPEPEPELEPLPEVEPEPLPEPELLPQADFIAELEEEIEPLYNPAGLEPSPKELVIEQQEGLEQVSMEPFATNTVAIAGRLVLGPTEFKQRLAECRQTELQSQTRYRLVIFVPEPDETHERGDQFAQTLSEAMAPTDDLAKIPAEGGRYVYALITAAASSEFAEQYAASLLKRVSDLRLRFFVLELNDPALSAFEN